MPLPRAFYCGSLSEMGREGLDLCSIGASGLAAAAIRAEPRAPWGLPCPPTTLRDFFRQNTGRNYFVEINPKLLTKVSTLNLIIFSCGGFGKGWILAPAEVALLVGHWWRSIGCS